MSELAEFDLLFDMQCADRSSINFFSTLGFLGFQIFNIIYALKFN